MLAEQQVDDLAVQDKRFVHMGAELQRKVGVAMMCVVALRIPLDYKLGVLSNLAEHHMQIEVQCLMGDLAECHKQAEMQRGMKFHKLAGK